MEHIVFNMQQKFSINFLNSRDDKMKRIIYIAAVNLDDKYSGITKKIYGQFDVFSENFDAFLIGYSQNGIMIKNNNQLTIIPYSNKLHRKFDLMENAVKLAKKKNITNAYIRRFQCNFFVLQMLKKLKKIDDMKILWEIPTYPYDYENHKTFLSKIYGLIDKLTRINLKLYINKIVTFSDEEKIFGINCINTSNGVVINQICPREINEIYTDINLIAVAVLNNWHGYDRIIKGLYKYYQDENNKKVVFHLVGDGPEFVTYKNLIEHYELSEYVKLYGYQDQESINEIYNKCEIAIESLGWHRSHVNKGTSLKSREYLAKGLPIVASTQMDVFLKDSKYVLYIAEDDSPVNILDIIDFYNKIYSNEERQTVNSKIRNIAYENCDMSIVMKPIIEFYRN